MYVDGATGAAEFAYMSAEPVLRPLYTPYHILLLRLLKIIRSELIKLTFSYLIIPTMDVLLARDQHFFRT